MGFTHTAIGKNVGINHSQVTRIASGKIKTCTPETTAKVALYVELLKRQTQQIEIEHGNLRRAFKKIHEKEGTLRNFSRYSGLKESIELRSMERNARGDVMLRGMAKSYLNRKAEK